jgi:hypothetical protein
LLLLLLLALFLFLLLPVLIELTAVLVGHGILLLFAKPRNGGERRRFLSAIYVRRRSVSRMSGERVKTVLPVGRKWVALRELMVTIL